MQGLGGSQCSPCHLALAILLLLAYLSELVSNELTSKARILVQIVAQYSVNSSNNLSR